MQQQFDLFDAAVLSAHAVALQAPEPQEPIRAPEPAELPEPLIGPLMISAEVSRVVLAVSDARCTLPWQTETTAEQGNLLVVDGRTIAEQCLHSPKLRDRVSLAGKPCGIIHGFTRALVRLLAMFKPTHVAVYFDSPKLAYRRSIASGYRPAQRLPAYWEQIWACQEAAEAMGCFAGLRWVGVLDYEAADLVAGTVSLAPSSWPVVIASTDSRLLQAAQRDDVAMTRWLNGEQETARAEQLCCQKYKVEPHQVADYLAIVGNHADGVPGVNGLGAVAARTLLGRYGSLEELAAVVLTDGGREAIETIEGLRGAARAAKLLEDGLDALVTSFRLVELRREMDAILPVDELYDLSWLRRKTVNAQAVRRLVDQHGGSALRELL